MPDYAKQVQPQSRAYTNFFDGKYNTCSLIADFAAVHFGVSFHTPTGNWR